MKTYHVFIASSLSFQKERDLMEKVLTERNNSELNIVVHRHEKNGDNDLAKGDTQEIINSEIRQCDVIIFFAGNWIRSKTIGEFNVAIENASNKHIYFYQNPTLEYTQEDWTNTTLWKDFYAEYMQKHLDDDTVIERYEKQCNTLEQLRDALVKDRESFLNNPFCDWVVCWSETGTPVRESYVNLIPTPAGGTHEAGLREGLFLALKSFMDAHGLMAKGVKLLTDDVLPFQQ